METMYQRGRIQEESLYYESRKHDGSLPLIGVNTFLASGDAVEEVRGAALIRSSEEEKQGQVTGVRDFQAASRTGERQGARAPAGGCGGARQRFHGIDGDRKESARWARSREHSTK